MSDFGLTSPDGPQAAVAPVGASSAGLGKRLGGRMTTFAPSEPLNTRGTVRTYLGTVPGVGKTYAMLAEGRRRQQAGERVVVGWVESHGRRGRARRSATRRWWGLASFRTVAALSPTLTSTL